jgi:hypothetical protein
MKLWIFSILGLALMQPAAKAADPDADMPKPNIVYRQKTAVSFDDAVVESKTDNPEGVYIVTPPEKQFGSLLKLRPNFHRELIRDSLLLK